jgi:hypothetical protein
MNGPRYAAEYRRRQRAYVALPALLLGNLFRSDELADARLFIRRQTR